MADVYFKDEDVIIKDEDVIFDEHFGLVSQHSFRWRNDDGDEDAATWVDALNADISFPVNVNIRIRFLLDGDTDPDSTEYRLEYKPSTATDWIAVTA